MNDPFVKVRPSEDGSKVAVILDQSALEWLRKTLEPARPQRGADAPSFNRMKSRLEGALLTGAVLNGWADKRKKR